MNESDILTQIRALMDSEHELRATAQRADAAAAAAQLRSVEEALDQCWDLLRQRRARQEFREDPDGATVRPVQEVEGYLQ